MHGCFVGRRDVQIEVAASDKRSKKYGHGGNGWRWKRKMIEIETRESFDCYI